ncbi:hypothetical protein FHS27_004163 [Rhodopirellula rubra]|uniref:Uncharacterized protein n=1 Tax=Aporhodopirellula rubra TaxID=980271 RepID=A0A7W5E1D6_9BACT|nr:hypothetical protein [Aporhodopirellula rubra]
MSINWDPILLCPASLSHSIFGPSLYSLITDDHPVKTTNQESTQPSLRGPSASQRILVFVRKTAAIAVRVWQNID